jgi:hypothetical protein
MSSTISRVLSWMVICLDCMLPYSSNIRFCRYCAANPKARRATVSLSVRPCFGWGLHSPFCYQKGGGLLNHLSILTIEKQITMAVYFCCTSLGVASTGCYPAPCPMKPGLSSPSKRCDHLCYSH